MRVARVMSSASDAERRAVEKIPSIAPMDTLNMTSATSVSMESNLVCVSSERTARTWPSIS